MTALPVNLTDGQFEIEGETAGWIALRCPAWYVLSLAELDEYGDRTGADRRLPRGTTRRFRRRPTITQHSMPFDITGEVTPEGEWNENPLSGWESNYGFLRDELVVDPGTTDGTRAARYTRPSGVVVVGALTVLAIPVGEFENGVSRCTLELLRDPNDWAVTP